MRYIHKINDKFTVGINKGENNAGYLSFAHCTREDNYSRKRARQIVDGRMAKNSGVISFYTELDEMEIWRKILNFLQEMERVKFSPQHRCETEFLKSITFGDKRSENGPLQYDWTKIVNYLFNRDN